MVVMYVYEKGARIRWHLWLWLLWRLYYSSEDALPVRRRGDLW